jgi:hypothetical protein
LRDAEGAPVRRRADHAGTGKPGHHALNRRVHIAGGDDLVADQPPLRAVALQPPLVLDRLPCDAVADEARQPHVGRARNDALLARGKRHERTLLGQNIVDRQENLAVTADGEGLHRRDPGLLDCLAAELVRRRIFRNG